jgi:hypothetical protein
MDKVSVANLSLSSHGLIKEFSIVRGLNKRLSIVIVKIALIAIEAGVLGWIAGHGLIRIAEASAYRTLAGVATAQVAGGCGTASVASVSGGIKVIVGGVLGSIERAVVVEAVVEWRVVVFHCGCLALCAV